MGLGLGGSKRLVNEFNIESEVGKGNEDHGGAMEVAFTEHVLVTDDSPSARLGGPL